MDNSETELLKLTDRVKWFLSIMAAPDNDALAERQTEAFFSSYNPDSEMTVPTFNQFCVGCDAAMKVS
jgi:hypothetical protein